jgi:hypothetical protein
MKKEASGISKNKKHTNKRRGLTHPLMKKEVLAFHKQGSNHRIEKKTSIILSEKHSINMDA